MRTIIFRLPAWRHILLGCVSLAVAASSVLALAAAAEGESDERDPREFFFIQTFGDLPEELALARQQGKQGMLLFFEAEACPYCQHMLRKVFSQKDVQDWYRERFASIAVDIHGDVELTDFDGITLPSKVFSDHRKVFLTPVVSFIDLEGQEVYRHAGMVKTAEEFLLLGEYIEGGHHFDTEFDTFAEQRGAHPEPRLVSPGTETLEDSDPP